MKKPHQVYVITVVLHGANHKRAAKFARLIRKLGPCKTLVAHLKEETQ